MPNSITVCMTWGGEVEIYVNDELVDTLSPSHRCWSKYIGEYGGMVPPGSKITLKSIPEEGMKFQKYEVFYFPGPDVIEVTENPWSFTLYDQEISIQVYFETAPPTKVVKVKVRVISVGTPPTSISAKIDGTPVGEITVNTPGEYKIGEVELEPGTYIAKATAIDSAGKTAWDEKQVDVG